MTNCSVKPGKLFMKYSFHGRPLIDLGRVIWDNIQAPLLVPQQIKHGEFITPNRFLLKIDNQVFLFYYEKFRLHGKELFIGPDSI